MNIMGGWKTWAAAIGIGILGIVDIFGNGDVEAGVQKLVEALALVGVAHKIEKTGKTGG